MTSKIEEAKNTCHAIGRLINRLNGAAVDIDKGGDSTYELLALVATTQDCMSNLSAQLDALHNESPSQIPANVSILRSEPEPEPQQPEPAPEKIQAVGNR